MFNWNRLYQINGNNNKRTGMAFEELSISYLNSAYPQYHWRSTKASWDGNRDFVSFVMEGIWGESKYKKDSSALRRQDIDPTILSGLLDGKVHLIVFVTNGTIPSTLVDRINKAGLLNGITIICITVTQLEYWLSFHPQVYKQYFQQELPVNDIISAITINCISFCNQQSYDFDIPHAIEELIIEEYYSMKLTFSVNGTTKVRIIEDDYPFEFVEKETYDSFSNLDLKEGIQTKNILIKITQQFNGTLIIKFETEKKEILTFAVLIRTYKKYMPTLAYAIQNTALIKISEYIKFLNPSERKNIVALLGYTGSGKSHLLKEILQEFYENRDITLVSFTPNYSCRRNDILICQCILFLNFGNLNHYFNGDSSEWDINFLNNIIVKRNNESIFLNEWITDLLDGCMYGDKAQSFIKSLSEKAGAEQVQLLRPSLSAQCRILMLDDIQYLNKIQSTVIKNILTQIENIPNNNLLILSEDSEGKTFFSEAYIMNKTPNVFKLNGLSDYDISESLNSNLLISQPVFNPTTVMDFPRSPLFLCDLICILKQKYLSGKNDYHIIYKYVEVCNEQQILNERFQEISKYYFLLDIIYEFPNGLSKHIFLKMGFSQKVFSILQNKGYIRCYNNIIFPSHILYKETYNRFRGNKKFNNRFGKFLNSILCNPEFYRQFDYDKASALIIRCGKSYYEKYIDTVKNKFFVYYNKAEYGKAIFYAEMYGEILLGQSASELTEDELMWLFRYAVCLTHCDRKRRGQSVFSQIIQIAPTTSLVRYMAQAEHLNNCFWRFQIKDCIYDAVQLKMQLGVCISQIKDESNSVANEKRIAFSTCMNRLMVITLLKDQYSEAEEIFNEYKVYNRCIPKSAFSQKYQSMWAEWLMDYARGLTYLDPLKSIKLYEESSFLFDKTIDLRRTLLCQLDLFVLKYICGCHEVGILSEIKNIENALLENGFISEYVKAVIKRCACKLVFEINHGEKIIRNDSTLFKNVKNEIYESIFKTNLKIEGRLGYIIYSVLAAIDILCCNKASAKEHLEELANLIQYCGPSYQQIIKHNLDSIDHIKTVEWCFADTRKNIQSYLLDPRIW